MRAMIFGAGKMGESTAWAMERLEYDLELVDLSQEALDKCNSFLDQTAKTHCIPKLEGHIEKVLSRPWPDIVICALPYYHNTIVAEYCIKNGIRYCDLGGNEEVSEHINNFASEFATKPVMTDLGLAPGLVNILAENLYKKLSEEDGSTPKKVSMMVGGLPRRPSPRDNFNYFCSWSIDGLINEYTENASILNNGEITSVQALEGFQTVTTQSLGTLEAFYTSGGASHSLRSLKNLGASNVSYKTLRWPGHLRTIKLLIEECELDRPTLKKIFAKNCGRFGVEDCVMIYISIDDKIQEMLVPPDKNFSAMQRCTGYGVACAAALIGEGGYDDEFSRKPLEHGDISFEGFNTKMEFLVDEEEEKTSDELQ